MKKVIFTILALCLIGMACGDKEPTEQVCNVKNPLTDLPWLKTYCDSIKETQTVSSVTIDLYKIINTDEHVFKIGVSYPNIDNSPVLYSEYWKNCIGELIFNTHSGTSPNPEIIENFMKDKEFVANIFRFVKQ